tara:strand:+ start:120 stop:530 length:411 start_codon:yes stop_codon:yes gene_type:complete
MNTQDKLQVYTQSGCGACIKIKEVLKQNNIEYKEKDVSAVYEEEFDTLAEIIGVWTTPTLVYNGHVLVSGRDFNNYDELPHVLNVYKDLKYDSQFVHLERFKTFVANTQDALEYIVETLSKLEKREYKVMYKDKED